MNYQDELSYIVPKTKEFINDIIIHSVYLKIDRMDDDSWSRVNSDQSLGWIYENLGKVTISTLNEIKHSYENMNERWNAPKHLEYNLELRENATTYILTVELPSLYLDYFITRYGLSRIVD